MNFTFNDVDPRDIRSTDDQGTIEHANRIRKSWVLLTKDTNFEDRLKSHPQANRLYMYKEIDWMIKREYAEQVINANQTGTDIIPCEIMLECAKDMIHDLDRKLQYYVAPTI